MDYCKDAYKLMKIKVMCGKDCPLLDDCPRLLLEDISDKAVEKAIKKLIKIRKEK